MKIKEEHKEEIIKLYLNELSCSDIANKYGYTRTAVKGMIGRAGKLRNQSEAGKLAAKQGKKNKAITLLIEAAKTFNRFNPLKANKGEANGKWIEDRTKVKHKRLHTEEKEFFREVLKERNYTCELSGATNVKLSVHHLNGAKSFPERRFDKTNVIVITLELHKEYHKKYGTNNITEERFNKFKGEYYEKNRAVSQ